MSSFTVIEGGRGSDAGISLRHLVVEMGQGGIKIIPASYARDPKTPDGKEAHQTLEWLRMAFTSFLGEPHSVLLSYHVGESGKTLHKQGKTDGIFISSRPIP